MRAVVVGLGRFGGGVGVARWLAARGARVRISDPLDATQLRESLAQLDGIGSGLELHLGEQSRSHVEGADLVVVNPALPRPWESALVGAALSQGAIVTTEVAIALSRLNRRAEVVGITGSAGKSTTTAMVQRGAGACGRNAIAGGNFGGSLLALPEDELDGAFVALELSSAMLWWLGPEAPDRGPFEIPALSAAGVTNFSPNHLDWHADEAQYLECKRSIFGLLGPDGAGVLGAPLSHWQGSLPSGAPVRVAETCPVDPVLPGSHNRENAALALALLDAVGIRGPDIERAVASFPGLAHRLEFIGVDPDGVTWINDSKCSTPAGTARAVDAVAERCPRILLIVGGADKGVDLSSMAELPASVVSMHAIGTTADAIRAHDPDRVVVHGCLEAAVGHARRETRAGDVILLSPACASWDQFANFEERGTLFSDLARASGARP